jgi:hypothetical protein
MTRIKIGSIVKSKDPEKSNYFQVDKKLPGPVTLQPGQYLSVESKKFQLESLQRALDNNKISPENAQKARERIEKIPDFVLGEVILVTK